jgi:hypothetical protein
MLARLTVTIDRKTGEEKSREIELLPNEKDDVYERLAEIIGPRIIREILKEDGLLEGGETDAKQTGREPGWENRPHAAQ